MKRFLFCYAQTGRTGSDVISTNDAEVLLSNCALCQWLDIIDGQQQQQQQRKKKNVSDGRSTIDGGRRI